MDGGSVGVMSTCGAREKKKGELLSGYGISNGIMMVENVLESYMKVAFGCCQE